MGSLLSSSKANGIHTVLSKESVICITSFTNLFPGYPGINTSKLKKLDGYSKTIYRSDSQCFMCSCRLHNYMLIASCDDGSLCYSCLRGSVQSFLLERFFLIQCLVDKDLCTLISIMLTKVMPIEEFDLYNSRWNILEDTFETVHQYVNHIRLIYSELVDLQLSLPSGTRVVHSMGEGDIILYRWILGNSDGINLSHSSNVISVTEYGMGQIHRENEYETMYEALSHVKQQLPNK